MTRRKRTIIHVNQHAIKRNRKNPDSPPEPVLTVKTYNSNDYAHAVRIHGPSELVYRPENPLSCGARVWVETYSEVEIIDQTSEKE
jgi:hypothetical protein